MHDEPIMDVAHLGHLEMLTPKPEESLRFFVDVLGMTESGRQGDCVYLRGWDDYERYSLKLTGSHTSGLGHAAFRARSPQALERRVAALAAAPASGWAGTRASSATAPPIASATPTGMCSSSTTRPNGTRRREAAAPGAEEPGAALSRRAA